jgi:hypothetical protein
MGAVLFDPMISDEERRTRLYAGDILIPSASAGTRVLTDLARQMLVDTFSPHDPRNIHEVKTAEEVAAILATQTAQSRLTKYVRSSSHFCT